MSEEVRKRYEAVAAEKIKCVYCGTEASLYRDTNECTGCAAPMPKLGAALREAGSVTSFVRPRRTVTRQYRPRARTR
jgi:hypothetical protein